MKTKCACLVLVTSLSASAQPSAGPAPHSPTDEVTLESAAAPAKLPTTLPAALATLDLEWEAIDEANGYELKLTPTKGGEPLTFKSDEAKASLKLPIGSYKLQIRSKDKASGYYGRYSDPTEVEVEYKILELLTPPDESILGDEKNASKKKKVVFAWSPAPNAQTYTMKIWSDDPDKAKEFKTAGTTVTLNLPSGRKYFWQVTFATKNAVGYIADPRRSSFMLLGPQLVTPVIDSNLAIPFVTKAKWSQSPGAERYEVRILKRHLDETEFTPIIEKPDRELNQLDFSRLAPGFYRIEVTAHAKNRVSSETGFYEFGIKPPAREMLTALQSVDALLAPPQATPAPLRQTK